MEKISLIIIFFPIVFGTFIYFFNSEKFNKIVFLFQFIMTLISFKIANIVINEGFFSYIVGGWKKGIGIEIRIDYLTVLFILMGIIGFWYIYLYIWKEKKIDSKFLFFITFLQGAIYGNILVYDIFSIYVLLELITIISSILIMYKKDGEAVRAGFYYLIFNSIGMTLFLVGSIIIYINTGSLNGTMIKEYIFKFGFSNEILIAFAFMLVAFFLKAALFPVFSWLPIAHSAAPSAISAILSGLIVKLGIYGIIRIIEIFKFEIFNSCLVFIGILTAFLGLFFAICQSDVKKILAYHTISQVGLITIGIGSLSYIGKIGGIFHIFNHFIFKSLLFLSIGVIIDIYGTRNIRRIKGLWARNKIISICLLVGMLSITGSPFFIGSVSKILIKKGFYPFQMKILFQFINLGTIISFIKLSSILWGKSEGEKLKGSTKLYALIFLTTISFLVYPIEVYLINRLNLGVSILSMKILLKESFNYLLLLFIGLVVYLKIIKKGPRLIKKFDGFCLGFRESNIALIGFLSYIILYVRYIILA